MNTKYINKYSGLQVQVDKTFIKNEEYTYMNTF
jgi:hypothetical protein